MRIEPLTFGRARLGISTPQDEMEGGYFDQW
jgi:hypothetical protein